MIKNLWSAVGAVLVGIVLIAVIIEAIQPYLWVVGLGVALMMLGVVAKFLYFRRRY